MSATSFHQPQPASPPFPMFKRQINHKREDYDLRVTFNQQQDNPQVCSFQISLKVYAKIQIMKYSCKFDNDGFPNDLKQTFSSLEILFEFFSEEKDFNVNILNGQILVKGEFEIGVRKVERKCLIKLQRVQQQQVQSLLQTLEHLEEEIVQIKKRRTKWPMEMKDEYEEKFEYEKRKLEQALKVRVQEEENYKNRQIQLQSQINNLRGDIGQIAQQITTYVKDNGKKLDDLKRKNHSLQVLLAQYQENYDELEVYIKGSKGRKMQRVKQHLQATRSINKTKQKTNQEEKNVEKLVDSKNGYLLETEFCKNDFRSMIDIQSPGFNRFRVQGKTITLRFQDGKQSLLWMKVPVSQPEHTFEMKIIQSKASKIWIGIMSRNKKQSKAQKTVVYGGEGRFWKETKIIGKGFQQGDDVKVITNLSDGTIQWKINGKMEASSNIMLCNNYDHFPCIFMEDYGDSVGWIGDFGKSD